jgi:DNA-binding response OmpR family regulator
MEDVLIVEDGQVERERLKDLFISAGYGVTACSSVTEAEQILSANEFRLAFFDIGLNDRSGSYLFSSVKRSGKVANIIIYTGNPSGHLRQRFQREGASDYIVKGSNQAGSQQLLARVKELIGLPQQRAVEGVDLNTFLHQFIPAKFWKLFLDVDGKMPACCDCGSRDYVVTFAKHPQVPPEINGEVVCAACGRIMDPEVG